MRIDPQALAAILGMSIVTYGVRAGGLWAMGRLALSPRIEAGLRLLPGAVLVSLVAPTVIAGGVAEKAAALATILVAKASGNLLLSIASGVGIVIAVRALSSGHIV